jgi:hypothetical protein
MVFFRTGFEARRHKILISITITGPPIDCRQNKYQYFYIFERLRVRHWLSNSFVRLEDYFIPSETQRILVFREARETIPEIRVDSGGITRESSGL